VGADDAPVHSWKEGTLRIYAAKGVLRDDDEMILFDRHGMEKLQYTIPVPTKAS
jgi:hypothetical protein